jgi:hypothetical protein
VRTAERKGGRVGKKLDIDGGTRFPMIGTGSGEVNPFARIVTGDEGLRPAA